MSCGTGSRTKERSIVEQAVNGGKACEGNSIENGVCNLKVCVGMYMLPTLGSQIEVPVRLFPAKFVS